MRTKETAAKNSNNGYFRCEDEIRMKLLIIY